MADYNIDKAKKDIENLQDQNSYDFQEIKRLDGLIQDYDKRVLQAINFNNLINKKIQDDYEAFKKSIIDDNLDLGNSGSSGSSGSIRIVDNLNSTSTTSALSANQGRVIKTSLNDINTRVDNLDSRIDNLNLGNGGSEGGSGEGLTSTQRQQLTTAYEHSQTTHVTFNDLLIPVTENEYNSLSSSEKADKFYAITDSIEEEYSLQLIGDVLRLLKGSKTISSIVLPTTASSVNGEIVISENNISIKKGNSGNINISLASAPTTSQIVNINCNNSKITINPSQLIFNSSNYSKQQTVSISVNTSITESSSVITVSSANVSSKNISLQITGNEPITSDNITSVTDGLIHSYDFSQGSGNQTTLNDLTGNCDIKLINFTFEAGETQNCGWNDDGSLSTNNSDKAYAIIDTTNEVYNLDNLDFTIAFKAQINGPCSILSSTPNKIVTPETGIISISYANSRNLAIITNGVITPESNSSLGNRVPYGTTDVFVASYSASTRTINIRNSTTMLGETILNEDVGVKTMKYLFSGNYHAEFRKDTNKIYKLAIYNKCLSNEEISTLISDLA